MKHNVNIVDSLCTIILLFLHNTSNLQYNIILKNLNLTHLNYPHQFLKLRPSQKLKSSTF